MQEIRYVNVNGNRIPVLISDEREALLAAKTAGRAVVELLGSQGRGPGTGGRGPGTEGCGPGSQGRGPGAEGPDAGETGASGDSGLGTAEFAVEHLEDADDEFLERVVRRKLGLPWKIYQTERLLIREIFADDFEEIWENQIGSGFETLEMLEAYTKEQYRFYGFGFWAVVERASGNLIGVAGLTIPREWKGEGDWYGLKLPPLEGEERYFEEPLELGYHIFPPYRRKGYAKEACLAVLDYGRRQLGVFHYQAWIQRENTVSQRFAEQLGFRKKEKACQGF